MQTAKWFNWGTFFKPKSDSFWILLVLWQKHKGWFPWCNSILWIALYKLVMPVAQRGWICGIITFCRKLCSIYPMLRFPQSYHNINILHCQSALAMLCVYCFGKDHYIQRFIRTHRFMGTIGLILKILFIAQFSSK